jgi:putative membrane protein
MAASFGQSIGAGVIQWSDKVVNANGLDLIHDAVVKAEEKTSAEIVPMIVRGSITAGHVPWMIFLVALLFFWAILPLILEQDSFGPAWLWEAGAILCSGLVALIAMRFDYVKRHFTTSLDQLLSVNHRALLEFHLSRVNATQAHTGVLIFVSLLEQRAVILADEKVAKHFSNETWKSIVEELVVRIKRGEFTGGMCDAITTLGQRLEKEFPISKVRAPHELTDRLIIKD